LSSTFTVRNRQRQRTVNVRFLRRIALTLLRDLLHVEDFDLGIYLVATPEMTRLNETFLRHKGSTDVIAFDYSVRPPPRPRNRLDPSPLHGEIFICLDEAVTQAKRFGTNWQSELTRYLIHGLLHLLGFDDHNQICRRKMIRAESDLLRRSAEHFDLVEIARSA
jgi:probable rRNA maturation factor